MPYPSDAAADGTTQLTFQSIAVAGQSTIVADTPADTLTVVGSGVTITTDAASDTMTLTVPTAAAQNVFSNIAVATQATIAADSSTDTLTIVAGTNITLTTDATTDTLTINAAGGGGLAGAAFQVSLTANQIIAFNTDTKVIFSTETIDTAGSFDSTVNYRHTPTVAGTYVYSVACEYANLAVGAIARLFIAKNGTLVIGSTGVQAVTNSPVAIVVAPAAISMNGTTDFIEFFTHNNAAAGGTLVVDTYTPGISGTYASGFKVT